MSPDQAGNFFFPHEQVTQEWQQELHGKTAMLNLDILRLLRPALLGEIDMTYTHKYPYDWRTKKPTIFRATEQWFASVGTFRADALEAIDKVIVYIVI